MSDTLSYVLKTSANFTLGAMASFLQKGADHAAAIEVEESVLLARRLAPDMFPLTRQVQIATSITIRGAARLAGVEPLELEDIETSFTELIKRCHTANDFVQGLDDTAINANGLTKMDIELGPMTVNWAGREYITLFTLPNLHFHAATAYGLLRNQGVPLGKRDFLMPG
jgi:hypothetical protein